MADKSQSDEKSSMAKAGKDFFDAGHYDKALEILQKLAKMTSNDAKVMHNIAVCEHYKNGFSQPQKQLQALRNIKSKIDERHGDQDEDALEEVDTSLVQYNQAVLCYQLKQYSTAMKILRDLFNNIEPIDEHLALKICALLIDVYIVCRCTEKADVVKVHLDKIVDTLTKERKKAEGGADDDKEVPSFRSSSSKDKDDDDEYEGLRGVAEDYRFMLHLCKAKLHLLNRSMKSSKREIKSALGIQANHPTAIFLKANLEYLRQNYKKAAKLLASCGDSKESADPVLAPLYFNNLAVINFRQCKYSAAHFYLVKALQNNAFLHSSPTAKAMASNAVANMVGGGGGKKGAAAAAAAAAAASPGGGGSLFAFGLDRQSEVLYTTGLQCLYSGRPETAFNCFTEAAQLFSHQPRLWLRMAECCVASQVQACHSSINNQPQIDMMDMTNQGQGIDGEASSSSGGAGGAAGFAGSSPSWLRSSGVVNGGALSTLSGEAVYANVRRSMLVSGLARGVVGSGRSRRVLLPTSGGPHVGLAISDDGASGLGDGKGGKDGGGGGGSTDKTGASNNGADSGDSRLSLELGMKCCRNVLALLALAAQQREDSSVSTSAAAAASSSSSGGGGVSEAAVQAALEGKNPKQLMAMQASGSGGSSGGGSGSGGADGSSMTGDGSAASMEEAHLAEEELLVRCFALSSYSYLSLCSANPLVAADCARKVLALLSTDKADGNQGGSGSGGGSGGSGKGGKGGDKDKGAAAAAAAAAAAVSDKAAAAAAASAPAVLDSIRFVCHLYLAEALCQTNNSTEALAILNPTFLSTLFLKEATAAGSAQAQAAGSANVAGAQAGEKGSADGGHPTPSVYTSLRSSPTYAPHARAVLYSNLACVSLLENNMQQAQAYLGTSMAAQQGAGPGGSSDGAAGPAGAPMPASLLTMCYIELRKGNSKDALAILKSGRAPPPGYAGSTAGGGNNNSRGR